jgi:hypothetical protein
VPIIKGNPNNGKNYIETLGSAKSKKKKLKKCFAALDYPSPELKLEI